MSSSGWRHGCALALALLLTACGGGGSDPRKTAHQDDPNRQAAGADGVAETAYLVIDGNPSQSAVIPHELYLVDPNTGDVFKTIDIGQGGSHELAGAFTPAANGQGGTRENASVLFFIRDDGHGQGRLFQTPLVGTQVGVETRISNLADACAIRETQSARLDAIATWLRVETAGADQDCKQTQDNQYMFVRSDFASTAAPVASPFGDQDVLVWEYNAQGELTWIYGYVPQLRALRAVHATTAAIKEVSGGFTGQVVRPFSAYPGDAHKKLVRVDRAVHVLSWLDGVATLGPAIITFADPYIVHVQAVDDQGAYFAEGLNVRRISAQGAVSTLATLPSGGGAVSVEAQTPTSLLVIQGPGNSASSGPVGAEAPIPSSDSTLWLLSKTGVARPVASVPSPAGLFVAGVSGETVVYGTSDGADPSNRFVTLKAFIANLPSQAPKLVASDVRYLYGVGSRQVDAYGDNATSHLLWCDVAGQSHQCREDRLRSYSLVTGNVLTLGPQAMPVGSPSWELSLGDVDYIDQQGRGILEGFVQDPGMPEDEFSRVHWLLNVDQAQSIKGVIALP